MDVMKPYFTLSKGLHIYLQQGRKKRPVVTGCTSNTRGFSSCLSDLLESVNKANSDPYEAISSEDMLSIKCRSREDHEERKRETV